MQAVLERSTIIHDDFGANVVHYAARNGSPKILRFLIISCRMNGNVRSQSGALPAHDAAAFGKLSALSWLLQNTDTSLLERDKYGQTFLHLAARFDYFIHNFQFFFYYMHIESYFKI
jgi:ankyrin repeat protein